MACYDTRQATAGRALGYVYYEDEPGRRAAAKLLEKSRRFTDDALQIRLSKGFAQKRAVPVQGPTGFDDAFGMVTRDHAEGLVVFADPLTFSHQQLIVDFAAKTRIAAMFAAREFVDIGGLMSYGPSYPGMFRRGAYLDRILRGTKPADLPVEQPTKFELVINLKTAKAPRTVHHMHRILKQALAQEDVCFGPRADIPP
jgi:ABC transporter substrate binding protein